MKYTKILLFTFFILSFFASCEKDKFELYHPNKSFYNIDYPYTIEYIGSNKFRYNFNELVEYVDVNDKTYEFFKYDDNNRIIKSYEMGSDDTTIYYYEYKENSIILDSYTPSGEIKSSRRILYFNQKGECIRNELWYYEEGKTEPFFFNGSYKEYEWDRNNLITLREYWNNELNKTLRFVYNEDVNPVRKLNCILIPEWAYGTYLSYNNIDTIYYTTSEFTAYKYDYSVENKIARYYYYEPHKDWIFDYSIGLKN